MTKIVPKSSFYVEIRVIFGYKQAKKLYIPKTKSWNQPRLKGKSEKVDQITH